MSFPWKPTPVASSELGVSNGTLKRRMEVRGGFLEAGHHYVLGPSKNSTITWNVEKCRDAFHRRGLAQRTKRERIGS